ncbi:hypothetical protein [Sinorhizobium sp. 8-89]|uniref:hypothetical protein n=1 Tax=Sinorhizobium sp. 8-89 TaxID=3049089 RepID=UPI003865F569
MVGDIAKDIERVYGKERLLVEIASASIDEPAGRVCDVIFPVVGKDKLAAKPPMASIAQKNGAVLLSPPNACFHRLKHFRRVATRYERRTLHFTGVIYLAAILIWLR